MKTAVVVGVAMVLAGQFHVTEGGSPPSDVLSMGGGADQAVGESIKDGVLSVPGTDDLVTYGLNNVKTWTRSTPSTIAPVTAVSLAGDVYAVSATHVFTIDDTNDDLKYLELSNLGGTATVNSIASASYDILKYSLAMDGLVYLDNVANKLVVMDTDGTSRSSNYEFDVSTITTGGSILDIVPLNAENSVVIVKNEEMHKVQFPGSSASSSSKMFGAGGSSAGAFANGDETTASFNSNGGAACNVDPTDRNVLCFFDDISRVLTFDTTANYFYSISTTQLSDYSSLAIVALSGNMLVRMSNDGDLVTNPLNGQNLAAGGCTGHVLAVVDRTFPKFFNQQVQTAYEYLQELVDEFDGKDLVDTDGIKMGIYELNVNSVAEIVDFSSNDAGDTTALTTAITNNGQGQRGVKSKKTAFVDLFATSSYGATIADDDVPSYILLFTDGAASSKKAINSVVKAVEDMKAALPQTNIVPKIFCLQTWKRVSNTKMLDKICDAKFSVHGSGSKASFVADVYGMICNSAGDENADGKVVDPCADPLIKQRKRCLRVKRNPTTGLATDTPKVRVCQWDKPSRTCSVQPAYASIFQSP